MNGGTVDGGDAAAGARGARAEPAGPGAPPLLDAGCEAIPPLIVDSSGSDDGDLQWDPVATEQLRLQIGRDVDPGASRWTVVAEWVAGAARGGQPVSSVVDLSNDPRDRLSLEQLATRMEEARQRLVAKGQRRSCDPDLETMPVHILRIEATRPPPPAADAAGGEAERKVRLTFCVFNQYRQRARSLLSANFKRNLPARIRTQLWVRVIVVPSHLIPPEQSCAPPAAAAGSAGAAA